MAGTAAPQVLKAVCKQVLSGDAIILRNAPRDGPPLERQLNLSGVTAPRLARRVANAAAAADSPADEPCAWESREFLRKKLVGQNVLFVIETKTLNGRYYGSVYLGKDVETGENIIETMVSEGLVQVRRENNREGSQRLIDLENTAKAQAKGKWAPSAPERVRQIIWSVDSARTLVEKFGGRPTPAVIEHVRDGSTVRAFLLPDMYYVTVMLSGVRCPTMRIGSDNKPDPDQAEEYFEMARFFVEARILQRDVQIVLESVNNANYVGSVLHPNGNIAELLLREGLARCVDWSIAHAQSGVDRLRAAERYAKEKRLRLWKDYTPANSHLTDKERQFSGKVIEVVNGDALMIKLRDGTVKKVFLSSVRAPRLEKDTPDGQQQQSSSATTTSRSSKNFRPLYDIPYLFEAREYLRRKTIGQQVVVHVDYVQPASELPERTCCTVMLSGVNLAEALLRHGLASVVHYRADDERRSNHYDALLAAEMHAKKAGNGMHARRHDSATVKVQDCAGDPQRSKQFFPFLQRVGRVDAIVEFVASGSRMRVYVPRETCLATFLLAGISCPRAARPAPSSGGGGAGGQQQVPAEPYGQQAYEFTRELCLQREVQVQVESMDKGGNFIGWLWMDGGGGGRNLSVELVAAGLARMHSSAESCSHYAALQRAEEQARSARKALWKDYVEPPTANGNSAAHADSSVGGEADTAERKVQYKSVVVTEVTPEAHFFVQYTDKGPELEKLMESIRSDLAAHPPLPGAYRPKRGDLCLAKFVDGDWYRARVERLVPPSQAAVLYIDYGNRSTVPFTDCAALPSGSGASRYATAPRYAKEFGLALTRLPPDADFAHECCCAFAEAACGRKLQLNVEYRDSQAGLDYASLCDSGDSAPGEGETANSDNASGDVAVSLLEMGLMMVQRRSERRLGKLLATYEAAQKEAFRQHLNVWRYGDITEDDA